MAPAFLSKSRYLNGMQCLRYLWLLVNEPQSVPEPDDRTRQLFDQGHLVQRLAERLFPDGVRLPEASFRGNIALTGKMLKEGLTFFEAGILADNIYARVDVLRPGANGKWDIVEVKSSTKVKDENINDISFQKHCCEKRGLAIDRCFLTHVNNQYVKHGEIDPEQFLVVDDVTARVLDAEVGIAARIDTMLEIMASGAMPDTRVGPHCSDPYECPVTACRESLPDNNVLELYRGGSQAFDLLYRGTRYLRDIPDSFKLSRSQEVQRWCDANSCAHVDADAIGSFVKDLEYPIHYLDFETFNVAVPLFDGTRPYQQVPFQFSLHVVDRPGAMAWHFGHLAEGTDDPRPEFFDELRKVIGKKGSIVVYNQSFEERIVRELAEAFPQHGDWAEEVRARLVDLLLPFRGFNYYHPDQRGSASIKRVLPALTGHSYDDMDINDGDAASLAYLNMTYGNMTAAQREETRAHLEEYCGLDTEGMIRIVDRLREIAR
jgi:hypothetical protein